jgi:hypothetical protein
VVNDDRPVAGGRGQEDLARAVAVEAVTGLSTGWQEMQAVLVPDGGGARPRLWVAGQELVGQVHVGSPAGMRAAGVKGRPPELKNENPKEGVPKGTPD